MIKQKKKNKILWIITALATVTVIILVFVLMSFVQKLLNEDVQINLTEVVTQNKDVISSNLKLEVNNLKNSASRVSDRLNGESTHDNETFERVIAKYCQETNNYTYFISDTEGNAVDGKGTKVSIKGRPYFKLALGGEQNISERLPSRIDGKEIFVFCAPLYLNDVIIGTLQKPYLSSEMYALCSISLFSDQGNMYIINSDGYIVIGSSKDGYNQETDNYYRTLYLMGNKSASEQLETDIRNNRGGFLQTVLDGKDYFSAYMPLDDLPNWYLITSVAVDAVSPNSKAVINMFYAILLFTVVAFSAITFCFLWYNHKQQTKIQRFAFVDGITGGNTYNKFLAVLSSRFELNPQGSFGILSFDVDNFKYINSYYGFEYGDTLLKKIYSTVSERLLKDEILARVSGDKFVALLTDISEERVRALTKINIDEEATVFISAGFYEVHDIKQRINLMVDKADTAAKFVKGKLHNKTAVYSDVIESTMVKNEQMKRKIERALQNKEFVPYFQPKINTVTGELVGAEALARWITADGKVIYPGEFIDLCEKTGQIVDLDNQIFEQTLVFLERNLANNIPCIPISVNFSRTHLVNSGFVQSIIERMDAHNVPHNLIELELTESVILENQQSIQNFVEDLHKNGLLICIDDFGSGYSSLNMLKDIPVDVLKIDKGFLDETKSCERQKSILWVIASMAEKLQMQVVVEGVETAENVRLMKDIGLCVAQGYYYYKPMDEKSFQILFQKSDV